MSTDEKYWWIPRHDCRTYITGKTATPIPKAEFDELCKNDGFKDGPYRSSFGDGYGEPYNPNRQAYGTLKDDRVVFTELSGAAEPIQGSCSSPSTETTLHQ